MTNLEAARFHLLPYEVEDGKLELLLDEQGLQPNNDYNGRNKSNLKGVYKAVIDALYSLKTLKKEQDNGSTIEYDVDKIDDMINRYRKKIDEPKEEDKPKNIDITKWW